MNRLSRFLVVVGTFVVVGALGKIHASEVAADPYDFTGSSRFAWSLAFGVLLCIAAYGAGLPDLPRGARRELSAAIGATASAALAVSLLQLLTGDALLPRFVVFGSAIALVPWYALCALLSQGGVERAEGRDRVAVVAGAREVDCLQSELALSPERPARVVVSLGVAEAQSAGTGRRPLVEAVVEHGASVVVLDRDAQADETVVAQAASLHEAGVRMRTLSLFYDEWLGKLPITELERVALMFDIGELHRARYGRLKRVADVILGAVGVVALVACLPVVLIGNLAANRGSLLYTQRRIGRYGREFTIYKLRTMRPGPSGAPNEWTAEDDPRITPFGRVLRRTHVDEIPQVINVLAGDLSIIGPRPEQPQYVRELVRKIPFYGLRHLVRPGLTGWAQVKYGYAGNEADALEKLQYDFYYLRHQGLALDARIVGRTVRSVLGRKGR